MRRFVSTAVIAAAMSSPVVAGGFADEIVEAPVVMVEPAAPQGTLPGWVIPAVLVAGLIALAVSDDDNSDDDTEDGGTSLSDSRLKTDITRIGTAGSGLPIYTFHYIGNPTLYQGVMAQDVLQVMPEAVRIGPFGVMAVNYDMIGVDFHAVD